jgi:hypothetical protein
MRKLIRWVFIEHFWDTCIVLLFAIAFFGDWLVGR